MGWQSGSSVDGSYSVPLIFAKLPEVNQEGSQWTGCEIKDTINLIYENLQRLDAYLSVLVRIFLYTIPVDVFLYLLYLPVHFNFQFPVAFNYR